MIDKAELISGLQEEYQNWQTLLDQIDAAYMDQPGVNGEWSMKDLVAHLTGWNRWLVDRLQAARHGEPEPPPPWPAQLKTDDEINAWIYEASHGRPAREILDESRQQLQQLFTVIEGLPDDVRIEFIEPKFHIVWLGDQYFPVGEFFDHFYDDHESDVRAWLGRVE